MEGLIKLILLLTLLLAIQGATASHHLRIDFLIQECLHLENQEFEWELPLA